MTRNDVLSEAIDKCIKEFYSIAQPHVEWEDLKEQCRKYSEKCDGAKKRHFESQCTGVEPEQWTYYGNGELSDI